MLDATDRQHLANMIRLHTDTIDYARDRIAAGDDDKELVEMIVHAQGKIAEYSAKLYGEFRQVAGCSR